MTMEFIDGFDHYGSGSTGITNALAGVYAEFDVSVTISNTQVRTGLFSLATGGNTNAGIHWRRVLSGPQTKVGVGMAIYFTTLPNVNNNYAPIQFCDAANAVHISIQVNSTGAIEVRRGDFTTGTILGTSTTFLTASAWSHIEAAVFFSNTVGTVEVRLNGVTVVNLSGIDTVNTSNVECSQVRSRAFAVEAQGASFIDDLYCWNGGGSEHNDFIGDEKCFVTYLDSDQEEADWVPNSGVTGYTQVDETSPDGDTTYIEAASIPESGQAVSEFGISNADSSIVSITCVSVYGMMRKTDAGASTVVQSLRSSNALSDGANRPLTTAYTYYPEIFALDPDTGAPWTLAGFNAALFRITRVE